METAPSHAQLTEIQRSARGGWESSCGTQGNRALCIQGAQAQSNLSAVLVDRPGANLLYSHLPFVAMSSVLLKWTLISEFVITTHSELVRQIHPHFFMYPK